MFCFSFRCVGIWKVLWALYVCVCVCVTSKLFKILYPSSRGLEDGKDWEDRKDLYFSPCAFYIKYRKVKKKKKMKSNLLLYPYKNGRMKMMRGDFAIFFFSKFYFSINISLFWIKIKWWLQVENSKYRIFFYLSFPFNKIMEN